MTTIFYFRSSQKLKNTESDRLQVQIQAYLDNVFDVGQLMEDSDTKNAALERVAQLEDSLYQVCIKFITMLCLTSRTTLTSARNPEENACHRLRNLCVFSRVQKRTLGFSVTSRSFSGMRQSIGKPLTEPGVTCCYFGDPQEVRLFHVRLKVIKFDLLTRLKSII